MTRTRTIYLALLAVLLSPVAANADLIWEPAPINFMETRQANSNFVTVFDVSANITLTAIAQETDLQADGLMNFFVFDATNGNLLFETGAIAFVDDGFNFNRSTDFVFNLLAGNTYAIGAVANVIAEYGAISGDPVSMNGITSQSENMNVYSGFLSPTLDLGQWCCDARVRLYSAPVPEPGTLALLSLGLVGMAARRRKKV